MKNGALLRLLREAEVAVFVTTDRNIQYQQHLAASGLAVVVLVAFTNTLEDLVPLVPALLVAIEHTQAGQVTHVGV